MKFRLLPTTHLGHWFVEGHTKFILHYFLLKRENSADMNLWNICLTSSVSGHLCIHLFKIWHDVKLYSLIPVWMTFMFAQGHRVMNKLELKVA